MLFDTFTPFNTVFQTSGRIGFLAPASLTIGENDMVLTMDLPGVTREDVEIEVLDGELVVRGERNRPELAEGSRWAFTERTFGKFERRIRLPADVDPDTIRASVDNGVLSLVIPKPEARKPKTIEIGSGAEKRELEMTAA